VQKTSRPIIFFKVLLWAVFFTNCRSHHLDVCWYCWLVFSHLIHSWHLLKALHKLHPAAPSPPGREPFNKRSHTCVIVFAPVQSISLVLCVYRALRNTILMCVRVCVCVCVCVCSYIKRYAGVSIET